MTAASKNNKNDDIVWFAKCFFFFLFLLMQRFFWIVSCVLSLKNVKPLSVTLHLPGSNFLCATHIIPVKNEEGVVMMFILNFDYILNEGNSDSLERLNHTSPSKADQCE